VPCLIQSLELFFEDGICDRKSYIENHIAIDSIGCFMNCWFNYKEIFEKENGELKIRELIV